MVDMTSTQEQTVAIVAVKRRGHPAATLLIDIVAPIALFYGIRGFGGSVWLALVAGGAVSAISTLAGVLIRRRVDIAGLTIVLALAASTALSLITGSPRALLARDGLITAGWAAYMYLSLFGRRPVTYTVSRPLLEGRRLYDPAVRRWARPVTGQSWEEMWDRLPQFRRIWRVATLIWGTAILADAVIRVGTAFVLPVGVVPAIGGALWPFTFLVLQVVTNVYFARSGFWQILRTGTVSGAKPRS